MSDAVKSWNDAMRLPTYSVIALAGGMQVYVGERLRPDGTAEPVVRRADTGALAFVLDAVTIGINWGLPGRVIAVASVPARAMTRIGVPPVEMHRPDLYAIGAGGLVAKALRENA